MATNGSFRCEVEESADRDEYGNRGGRIIVDLGDVSNLDSSGLGTLVGLKASAINKGLCILEFRNMTPRVLELLRITKLTQIFSSNDPDSGPFFS